MIQLLSAFLKVVWIMVKTVVTPPTVKIMGSIAGKETYMGNYTPSRVTVLWWHLALLHEAFRGH